MKRIPNLDRLMVVDSSLSAACLVLALVTQHAVGSSRAWLASICWSLFMVSFLVFTITAIGWVAQRVLRRRADGLMASSLVRRG